MWCEHVDAVKAARMHSAQFGVIRARRAAAPWVLPNVYERI